MTIAVTTPTGNVGSQVVRLLVQAGVRPRVLVRDPDKLPPGLRPLVEVAQGDLLDAAFVAGALQGADALFWASPESFTAPDPLADMVTMGAHAASAVRAAGVARVLQISSVGAERKHGAGLIDGLARNEEQLRGTGADVLTLRCGYFFTNLLGMLDALRAGVLTTTMPLDQPLTWVDPRDIGEVSTARLLAGWSGSDIQAVHGPADLSWSSVASILSAATGRPLQAQQITDDALRSALLEAGLTAPAAAGVVGMTAGTRDDFTPEQKRDFVSTTPSTLEAWAYTTLRPLLQ
ncbi:NmrA family NAD(P)-binding protein [Paractinoplanes lichenicola]|uniref:NAD(P)H-binding protein n=1 Tax=Paractinoplanes lichenicola TaxID=2802976 RepID=A0ABS1VYH3_9ACTN|nr:NAD(P)H-binding protein [Actinoplanes lichenicola]MBL7259531.1 NAD(P)H-binding protein [Actinoplanes lichenicola]